ncbi:MAG: hypothetical protein AMXMBFR46_04500 [Acidimicrobiia bacterium]
MLVVLVALLAGGVALERRAPDATPVSVENAAAAGPVVPSEDAVSTAWYCAAGSAASGGAATETVFVANVSARDAEALVTVFPGEGETPRTRRIAVDAYARESVDVASIAPSASPGVLVEVLGAPAIVEHELRSGNDLAMGACAREPARTWYFAGGGTARGATQWLELFNPFGDDAIVDISFLTEAGVQEPQALQGFVVERRTKVAIPVHDQVPRQERVATVVRTRTGRIVAEQQRAFDGTDGHRGIALSLGVPAPGGRWTIPVASGATTPTGSIAIANFGLGPAEVEVSIALSGDGVLAPESVDVPSRSVVVFEPSARVPAGTAYAVVVRALGRTPVVAEAVLHAGSGAATTLGAAAPARRWAIAGSPFRASSAVIAANRADHPVTVELRAHTAGDTVGPSSAPAIAVPPGKVVAFDLDEWGIDPDQVLVVTADGPIVAGREVYGGGTSVAVGVPFGG